MKQSNIQGLRQTAKSAGYRTPIPYEDYLKMKALQRWENEGGRIRHAPATHTGTPELATPQAVAAGSELR
jgi:hypothetical protein